MMVFVFVLAVGGLGHMWQYIGPTLGQISRGHSFGSSGSLGPCGTGDLSWASCLEIMSCSPLSTALTPLGCVGSVILGFKGIGCRRPRFASYIKSSFTDHTTLFLCVYCYCEQDWVVILAGDHTL